jgi:uncharacterized membrane protein YfcA
VPVTGSFAVLLVATLGTAALSAVVGMGGGMTLLAVMAALMPAADVVPLHGVVQLFSNGTRTLLLLRHVHTKIFLLYLVPAVLGVWIGAQVYTAGALVWFRPAVGAFILLWLATLRFEPRLGRLPLWIFAPLGLFVGMFASLLGATGPLIAPFFLRDDLDPEQVIGTKAAVQIVTHFAKIPAFVALGYDYAAELHILVPLIVAAIVGTVLGRRVLAGLSGEMFRRIFYVVLAVIGVCLLLQPLV